MTILVTLTSAGTSTTLFNLYSNLNYVTPLATGITRATLLAGYFLNSVPDSATSIRVTGTGVCTNSIDIAISGLTTTTSTSTSSTSSTSTSSTTSTTTAPTTSSSTSTSTSSTTSTTTSPTTSSSTTTSTTTAPTTSSSTTSTTSTTTTTTTAPPLEDYTFYQAEYFTCLNDTCSTGPFALWFYNLDPNLIVDKYYYDSAGDRSYHILDGPFTYAEYVTAGTPPAIQTDAAFASIMYNSCTCLAIA